MLGEEENTASVDRQLLHRGLGLGSSGDREWSHRQGECEIEGEISLVLF